MYFRRNPGESKLNLKSMRQQMKKIKNQKIPKAPKNLEQIHDLFQQTEILEQFGRTQNNQHMFYSGTVSYDDFGFTIFSSHATIQMVKENIPNKRIYLIDGTFKVTPSPFYQLLTISIEFNNDVSFFFNLSF